MKDDRITAIDPMSDSIGKHLLEFRMQVLLSQTRLAECIGTSSNRICNWEKGKVRPTALNVRKINNFIKKYWEEHEKRNQ